MSLSRPDKLPLLKLPWLCIKCVLLNSDLFDMIYFATISKKTRRIVKNSKYSLKNIDVSPSTWFKSICIGDINKNLEIRKIWYFVHYMGGNGVPLVLTRDFPSLLTSRGFGFNGRHYLKSYTTGDDLDALKMGTEFMIDVFGCIVSYINVAGNELSKLVRLGISSVKVLFISNAGPVNLADLKCLLETVKVTDEYSIHVKIPKEFYCEPRIFKCRKLHFGGDNSADWITLDILCQLNVPKLSFLYNRFSKEDIVSYVTYWFNSENRKLEYFFVSFDDPVSFEDFKIDNLNPMPFCEKRRNRCIFVGEWENTDMSSGMDILRQDGLLATLLVKHTSIIFHIWHKRFPDTV
ncbi:unnamed protein product [Caenorhabditis brenneri]